MVSNLNGSSGTSEGGGKGCGKKGCGTVFEVTPGGGMPKHGLIGFWKGDGNADDSSRFHNNGSYSGSYVQGHLGNNEAFDLSTGSVSVPNISAYNLQKYKGWTVGFWFNTNGVSLNGGDGTFLGDDDGSGCTNKWFVDYDYNGPPNTFVLHLNDTSCLDEFLHSRAVTIKSGWNQLAVVKDVDKVAFYLNGRSIGTAKYKGITPYPSAPLSFGALESCCNYYGWMDYVVLYNRALTAAEVEQLSRPE